MTRKRSILLTVMSVICLLTFLTMQVSAQNPVEDAIKQLTSDNVKGYVQPFITAFGANMNSGVYHTASADQMGFTLRLDLIAMGTLIGDAEKKYKAINPYDDSEVETATIFGEQGAIVGPIPGVEYQFQNGQVKTSVVPFFMPQLTVGDVFGTQAIIRYVPIPEVNNVPKINLFGIGARHNVSQYIPAVPVDLSASIFYQSLKVGDLFEANTLSFGAQVSKSFAILTLYGGLQYESMSMDLNYTYTGNIPGITVADPNISLTLDGKNKFRGTAGLDLSLALLHIFADINVGNAIVVSGGIGFGF
ncbi:MAG: hypothetical protein HZB59_03710 [Ignavibacteriales bacterium]|nr:hypothetical protein [Ignavibacteriales bacterium]